MKTQITIAGRPVGDGCPTYVVAEVGVNHNGDVGVARDLVSSAHRAGADAVKFQTFKPQALCSPFAPRAAYQEDSTGGPSDQLSMLQALQLPDDALLPLMLEARQLGIAMFSTPFDQDSLRLLTHLEVPAYKVASPDIVDLPLLELIAAQGRPVILSTGMATLGEIEAAVECLRAAGCRDLILLQATSSYPAPPQEANLRVMQTLRSAFGVPVGLSDHSPGTVVSIAAVALGACLIEKHLTLDHTMAGPDHKASLDGEEFSALVQSIRVTESALGTGIKAPAACELTNRPVVRKSLCAARALAPGHRLVQQDLALRRPGTGLAASQRQAVLGRRLKRHVAGGEPIDWDCLD